MPQPHDLQNKSVLITGGSRGLGAALAVEMGRAGAKVSICARSEDKLRAVADRVRDVGARCIWRQADMTDEQSVRGWVEASVREYGSVDVLVNNASILGPRIPLESYPIDTWRDAVDINLTGPLIAIQAVLPHMRRSGGGSVINVSSGAAIPPRIEWGAYAVSKLALDGLTANFAAELEGTGIRVNTVDPGAMRTQMRAAAYPDEDPATLKTPADAAAVFLWLASDASRDVTGQRFQADEFGR